MKKFTSLLMLFCMFVGMAWAAPTDLPEMSEGENIKWYTISNTRSTSGDYLYWTESGVKDSDQRTAASFFYFTGSADECYIHNYSTELLFSGTGAWTAAGVPCKLSVSPLNTGFMIGFNGTFLNEQNFANGFTTWGDVNDAGSIFVVEEVTDFSAIIDVPAAKTAAITELENLKKIELFNSDVATIDAAISEIEGVVATENSLAALDQAYNAVYNLKVAACDQIFNKNIRLTSYGRNTTDGHDLVISAAGAYGVTNSGDAGIWTMKGNGDGTFSLYNFAGNLYLGPTVGQSARVPSKAEEAEAGHCSFKLYNEGTQIVNIISGGQPLHVAGDATIVQWWDNDGASNQWKIAECPEIVVSREDYDAAVASAAILPNAIQQAYGLVTDASQFSSNAKEVQEGTYEGLIDNTYSTFFHSSWSATIGDYHYLQVELAEGIEDFYFYFKKREQNNNNRPTEIDILGSADGTEFSLIKTINSGLPTGGVAEYISELVNGTTSAKYIRFVVKATNNGALDGKDSEGNPAGHPFFTFSEFYVLPANSDIANLLNAYTSFASSSITSESMAAAATALINAEATLSLANIKKEVNAILTANASKHAEIPALGQYSTAGYDALNAAYTAIDATQESLEAAIAAFKKSKNLPVFTISGTKDYVVGKSIYDDNDGTLNFKATNNYDKSMWWVFDQTATTVGVTDEVVVTNYATNRTFWNAPSVRITETSEANAEDGIFLLYTKGNGTPVHFQNDNQVIVRWNSTEANSGSAMTFTIIGTTYELDQLTDEKVAALANLQTAYNAVADFKNATIGTGLGEYTGSKDAIIEAVAAAEVIGAKTLAEQAQVEVATIEAVTTALNECADDIAINLPVAGKYYRFQGACEATLPNYYITGHTNADGGRIALTAEADASTIYYFDGTNLIAYQSGLVIGLNNSHWTFASVDDNSKPASVITFTGSPRKAGAYSIKSADRYFHYTVYNSTVQVNRCSEDVDAEHAWYITEVTELPVTITAAGYATFYAPVEVTLPAEVTAHTVTKNGEWATLSEAINVVPAENGVILAGEAGTYNLTISNTGAENLTNALAGTVAKTLVSKEDGAYYILAAKEDVVGLYTPVNGENNVQFYNAGHKAYWYIPGAAQAAYLRFDFGTETGIGEVETEAENAVIFDLAGRRVQKAQKGLYIVNGKKVVK